MKKLNLYFEIKKNLKPVKYFIRQINIDLKLLGDK